MMQIGSRHCCFSCSTRYLSSVLAAALDWLPHAVSSDGKDMDASRGHVQWLGGRSWGGKDASFPRGGDEGWTWQLVNRKEKRKRKKANNIVCI